MIKLIQGNIFDTTLEIICHGVNCRGGFGSGLAGQIAKRWPRVRQAYLYKFNKEGWELGDMQLVFSTDKFELPIIANIATQKNYGYDGNLYADYNAIRTGLKKVFDYAARCNLSIAMPKIGAGLAGGDWNVILKIIQKISLSYPNVVVEIYYYDK